MKWLKKFATIIYIIILLGVMMYVINSDAILTVIRNLSKSDKGILVQLASYVKSFFKHADTWNFIFITLSIAICIVLFMAFNFVLNKVLNWIAEKKTKLSFLRSSWADYVIQFPVAIAFLAISFLIGTNIYVPWYASRHTVESVDKIEKPMPVFVLGTSKMLSSGKGENVYYRQRITAAMELYSNGKVTYFILSGDGGMDRKDGYNETRDMRNDLLAEGVPDEKIKIDTAGFRTLDSMLRLRALFRLNDIIIVSQAFHTPRAVVLGEFYGLHTVAYNSKGSATRSMFVRELGSRPRMIMDMLFFNMQPKVTTPDGEALQHHGEFTAETDGQVLLFIGTIALGIVMFVGVVVFANSKTIEERKKALKRYSLIGSGVTVGLIVLLASVYQISDIKFIDQVVEAVVKTVGVKTEKMEVKQERKEKVIETIKLKQTTSIVSVTKESVPTQAEEKPKVIEFNTTETALPKAEEVKPEPKKEEPKAEEDLFNTAEGEGDAFGDNPTSTASKKTKQYFKASVYRGSTLKHDGVITLQLEESVSIGGKVIPANHIFEGKTILYNNRFIIVADIESNEIKNYESGKEGNAIQARHQGKKGEVVLAEGEALTFGF